MTTDDKNGAEIKKVEEMKPVVWTPEDASRFLTSAIHEAQRPLADALKQRPITTKALVLLVGVIIVLGLAIALILSSQLEKAETRADTVQDKHDVMLAEKHELQAQHTMLQDRLTNVSTQHDELRASVESLRRNEEAYRRTKSDLSKYRRLTEALRNQISGLELEKTALARQLEALKFMMSSEQEEGDLGEMGEEGLDLPFDEGNAIDDFESPDQATPKMSGPDDIDDFVVEEELEDDDVPVAARELPATPTTEPVATPEEAPAATEPPVTEDKPEEEADEPARSEPVTETSTVTAPQPAGEPEAEVNEPAESVEETEETILTTEEPAPTTAETEAAVVDSSEEAVQSTDKYQAISESQEPVEAVQTAPEAVNTEEHAEPAPENALPEPVEEPAALPLEDNDVSDAIPAEAERVLTDADYVTEEARQVVESMNESVDDFLDEAREILETTP